MCDPKRKCEKGNQMRGNGKLVTRKQMSCGNGQDALGSNHLFKALLLCLQEL